MRINRIHLAAAVAAFACALCFALYTQHAWEDWYITYRASKNLATGNGLVYNLGERFHTFTSVLGTLIPALLNFVTFNRSDDLVLWLYRLLNCVVLGCSAYLLIENARKWFAFVPSVALLVGVFILDTKTLDFTVNGMETPYLLLSLCLFFHFITSCPVKDLKLKLGAVWALFEYTRPDGVVYIVVLMAALLIFLEDKREVLKTIAVSGLVAALLFAPWFIFTLAYYGTPIPHSIAAKSGIISFAPADIAARVVGYLKGVFLLRDPVSELVFSPPYGNWLDLPVLVRPSRYLTLLGSLAWLIPGIKPPGRIASFSCFCLLIYLAVLPPFVYPWYLPGPALLALIGIGFCLDAVLKKLSIAPKFALISGWCACSAFLAYMLAMTLIAAHQFRLMQRINERENRQQIGLWLKENSKTGKETVFLECVGYVGFYSGLKMYDFPGMTSDEMVQARKLLQTDYWLPLIKHLKPDWLVLRPGEFYQLWLEDSVFFLSGYERMESFDVSGKIDRLNFKPYQTYFYQDARFMVIRKTGS